MNKYIIEVTKVLVSFLFIVGLTACKKEEKMEVSGTFVKTIRYDYDKYIKNLEVNEDNEELVMTYEFDMDKGEGMMVRKGLSLCNCNAKPVSKVTVEKNKITIENVFPESGGTCNNFFDVYTKIKGVQKQKYHIEIIEGQFGYYTFDIDLSEETEGKYYY
ncbi:MAG: hypothetical protein IJJ77_09270 [Paludibacteraceae bacterium]|nr:hypothetical protein [Paludibacteraceae bacterium]